MVTKPTKCAWQSRSRFVCLLLTFTAFTQPLASYTPDIQPDVYLPRFEFVCPGHISLEKCSTEDLDRAGWKHRSEAEDQLSTFTLRVLSEAQKEERLVEEIKGDSRKALKVKENELVQEWRKKGAVERSRPWIIEVDIQHQTDDSDPQKGNYLCKLFARRVGDNNELYPEVWDTQPGKLKISLEFPAMAQRLVNVSRGIFEHRKR